MPIIPSVFQPIRANDYQQRPIKTYKHYKVSSNSFPNLDGYFRHSGIYRKHVPHIDGTTGQGVGERLFPINTDDNTNQHVIWNAINHKYYRNNNPAEAADFLNINDQHRFIWYSASLFTAPYGQVGEKIKHGTFAVTSSIGNTSIHLSDDSNGNLTDNIIDTTTFASSSRNFFYMSFNDLYKKFNDYDELGELSKGITYKLNKVEKSAIINNSVTIVSGIEVTSSAVTATPSGLATQFQSDKGSQIRIPHNDKFDRFGRCDDWTISLWHKTDDERNQTILSKWGVKEETYLDSVDGKRKTRTVNNSPTEDILTALTTETQFENNAIRTPLHIVSGYGDDPSYHFIACDGKKATRVTTGVVSVTPGHWQHVCVRNSASKLEIFVNGVTGSGGTTGTLPDFTSNAADVVIGNTNSERQDGVEQRVAEIRMYDYAVNNEAITSLGNKHYLSASCYQTNVVGNVFYKNGQAVASSPLPKYNSGSGIFGNTWDVKYRGTHTIYENECLVRVPKDQFNVTMNPTSTYRPVTDGDVCDANQTTLPPGELRKGLFVSGTLKPYITSIGLYNDKAEMLASAKLAQPIQKTPDVDMNFVVRWDY